MAKPRAQQPDGWREALRSRVRREKEEADRAMTPPSQRGGLVDSATWRSRLEAVKAQMADSSLKVAVAEAEMRRAVESLSLRESPASWRSSGRLSAGYHSTSTSPVPWARQSDGSPLSRSSTVLACTRAYGGDQGGDITPLTSRQPSTAGGTGELAACQRSLAAARGAAVLRTALSFERHAIRRALSSWRAATQPLANGARVTTSSAQSPASSVPLPASTNGALSPAKGKEPPVTSAQQPGDSTSLPSSTSPSSQIELSSRQRPSPEPSESREGGRQPSFPPSSPGLRPGSPTSQRRVLEVQPPRSPTFPSVVLVRPPRSTSPLAQPLDGELRDFAQKLAAPIDRPSRRRASASPARLRREAAALEEAAAAANQAASAAEAAVGAADTAGSRGEFPYPERAADEARGRAAAADEARGRAAAAEKAAAVALGTAQGLASYHTYQAAEAVSTAKLAQERVGEVEREKQTLQAELACVHRSAAAAAAQALAHAHSPHCPTILTPGLVRRPGGRGGRGGHGGCGDEARGVRGRAG